MDPLSITLSISALLKLTKDVVSYVKDVKEASDERKKFIRETASLSGMLNTLVDFVSEEDPYDPWLHAVNDLVVRDGPFDQFAVSLQSLKVELTSTSCIRKLGKALMWKHIRDDVQGLLARIERLKSLVGIALDLDHIRLSQEIKSILADVTSVTTEIRASNKAIQENTNIILDETYVRQKKELLDKICSADYMQQHRDAISRHHYGTGEWFLTDHLYQEWNLSPNGILACPGAPGAGKTIMAALVIEQQLRMLQSSKHPVVFIYYNYKRQDQQTLKHTLETILRQIVDILPEVPASARILYNNRNTPSTEEIKQVLKGLLVHVEKLTIVTDALDECQDDARHDVLSLLIELRALVYLRYMATTRDMRVDTSHSMFKDQPVLEIRATRRDLEDYTRSRAKLLRAKLEPDLLEELVAGVITAAEGMFLMAQLLMDSFQVKLKVRTIRSDLQNLPKGVDAYDVAYEDAMARIFGQEADCQDVAQKAMSLVLSARRPLETIELQHALMIETGDVELDEENRLEAEVILSVCAGLLTIDESSETIRFVHYTTQEYLQRTKERWLPEADLQIARACLDYLLLPDFRSDPYDGPEYDGARLEKYSFKDYAIFYGPFHWDALVQITASLCPGLLTLLVTSQAFSVIREIHGMYEPTALHWIIRYGHVNLAEFCIINGGYCDSEDEYGHTPLSYAAAAGHQSVVRLLLDRNASLISKNVTGRTPLSLAVKFCHESVARMLLEQDAFVDPRDDYQCNPLMYAAEAGNEPMVRLLLEHGANTNSKDDSGWSPLIYAAFGGHDQIAQSLLEHDATVDSADRIGRTALSHAVLERRESTVRALLQAGAKIDCKEKHGKTPLAHAARIGDESMVRILLEHNAFLSHEDDWGLIPLSCAAKSGHEQVVNSLLEHSAAIDSKTGTTQTACILLSRAAEMGHSEVVRLLLDRQTDPNVPNHLGQTPLHLAVIAEYTDIVRILCSDSRIKAVEIDSRGQTPLSYALAQKDGYYSRSEFETGSVNKGSTRFSRSLTFMEADWSESESGSENQSDPENTPLKNYGGQVSGSKVESDSESAAQLEEQTQGDTEFGAGTESETETESDAQSSFVNEALPEIETIINILRETCNLDPSALNHHSIPGECGHTAETTNNSTTAAKRAELPLDKSQAQPPTLDQSLPSPSASNQTDRVPGGPETKDHCSLLATFPQ